jgi:hypothetical protein
MRRLGLLLLFAFAVSSSPLLAQAASDCAQTPVPPIPATPPTGPGVNTPATEFQKRVLVGMYPEDMNAPSKPLPGLTASVTESEITGIDAAGNEIKRAGWTRKFTTGPDGCFVLPARAGFTYHMEVSGPGLGSDVDDWSPSGFADSDSTILLLWVPKAGYVVENTQLHPAHGGLNPEEEGAESNPFLSEQGENGNNQKSPSPLEMALTLLAIVAYFLLQEITVRVMANSMMKRAAVASNPATVEEISAASAPATATAPSKVEFVEMNSATRIALNGAAAQRLKRIRSTQRRKLWVLLVSMLVQLAALAAAAKIAGGAASWIYLALAAALDVVNLFWILNAYFSGKRLLELIAVVDAAVITVGGGIGMFYGVSAWVSLPAAALQIAVLWLGWRRLRRGAAADGNRRLVILRVFNCDRNAAATFGELMSRWRFAGSFLTISDPSYVRYQFSVFTRGNFTRSLMVTMTLGAFATAVSLLSGVLAQYTGMSAMTANERQAILYTVIALLAIVPIIIYTRRRFLKTPAEAMERLARMERRTLGVETDYRGEAYFCHDDVWKPAVHKMLEEARIAMMDLRGFSEKRRGCAYEIGLLIDRYPVTRLLFLVDKTTPRDLLQSLIRNRWATMRAGSPNAGLGGARIILYETGKKTGRDNQNILSILAALVDGRLELQAGKMTYFPEPVETDVKVTKTLTALGA